MMSFFRFATLLLVTAMMVILPESLLAQTNNTDLNTALATCEMEIANIFTCLASRGVTEQTFADASVTQNCEACYASSDSLSNPEGLKGKPCSEVQAVVDGALVECQEECKLEGCTTEVTQLMSCIFTNSVDCTVSAGVAFSPATSSIMLVAATMLGLVIAV